MKAIERRALHSEAMGLSLEGPFDLAQDRPAT